MPISPVSASAVRSVQPTVQSTAKSENASTNSPTPVTAAHPNASQFDQARLFSLAVIPAPKHAPESPILTTATEANHSPRTGRSFAQTTLAAAALVGSSLLPVASGQSINQQIATLTGIANGLLNATATNAAQIELVTGIANVLVNQTAASFVREEASLAQIETLTGIANVLVNQTAAILVREAASFVREEASLDAATRAENALARIELIACFGLAVAAVIFIPFVIKLINSAIGHFSPSTPTPPAPLNPALVEEDLERGSNHSAGDGSWANQPFESGVVAINLDASSHSSHASNLGEEKDGEGGSIHSSHDSNSGEEKA